MRKPQGNRTSYTTKRTLSLSALFLPVYPAGFPVCHELTSIRYAIFTPGLVSIPLRADSQNDLLFKTRLHASARALVVRLSSRYIHTVGSVPLEHQRWREILGRIARSVTQMECVTTILPFPAVPGVFHSWKLWR